MVLRHFFGWGRTSLVGNIALFESFLSAPFFVVMSLANYLEGTLTLAWALWIALISAILGVVVAVPIWFLLIRPRVLHK
jgi:hypothetical protein